MGGIGNGDSMMIGGKQFIFCPPEVVWLKVCDGWEVQLFLRSAAAAIAVTAAAAAAMPVQVIVMTIV